MNLRKTLLVLFLGPIFGALIGSIQIFLFPENKYIASVEIRERVTFGDLWSTAPVAIKQIELLRYDLNRKRDEMDLGYELIVLDTVDAWFRLLDNTLFTIVIDKALTSASIGNETRYAVPAKGYEQGLNQRSIILNVVSADLATSKKEVMQWAENVQGESSDVAYQAVTSWLDRKADAFGSFAHINTTSMPDVEGYKLSDLSEDFLRSAQKLGPFKPYFEEQLEVREEKVQAQTEVRFLIWIILGVLFSMLLIFFRPALVKK